MDENIAIVRAHSIDLYLSTLFLPAEIRDAIFTLYAFSAEIARIRDLVQEPIMGEVRLQWWRDIVSGERASEAASHPLAAGLLRVMEEYTLPQQLLLNLLDSRVFDLYNDPMGNMADFEGYAGETTSGLFQMAATIANQGKPLPSGDCAGHAGVVICMISIMKLFPMHRARQQCFVPADILANSGLDLEGYYQGRESKLLVKNLVAFACDHLGKFRNAVNNVPDHVRAVFLPMAIAGPALNRFEKESATLLSSSVDIAQWRKQIILWRAARSGAF